jgi:hypothetical protein
LADAALTVVEAYAPDPISVITASEGNPEEPARTYTSFKEIAEEGGDSRVLGGVVSDLCGGQLLLLAQAYGCMVLRM